MAGYDKPKTPFELVDPSGSIRITQLSPVGEREDSQRMTATGKGFNIKRPHSNRNADSESKGVQFEEVARNTQVTHKSDLAPEEADQMHLNASHFTPKIVIENESVMV